MPADPQLLVAGVPPQRLVPHLLLHLARRMLLQMLVQQVVQRMRALAHLLQQSGAEVQ